MIAFPIFSTFLCGLLKAGRVTRQILIPVRFWQDGDENGPLGGFLANPSYFNTHIYLGTGRNAMIKLRCVKCVSAGIKKSNKLSRSSNLFSMIILGNCSKWQALTTKVPFDNTYRIVYEIRTFFPEIYLCRNKV